MSPSKEMRFLSDENVRKRLVKVLSEAGHDVKLAEKRIKNSALFILAEKESRILLTNDRDFLEANPGKSTGIIVLRVFPDTFENQKSALLRVFSKFKESEFFGKVVAVDKNWEAFGRNKDFFTK